MSGGYLEKALLKIARQINSYDEASMMDLWERYAEKVRRFEPNREWEEAAVVLSIIQGMRLKNQLFNHNWSQARLPEEARDVDLASLTSPQEKDPEHCEDCESADEGDASAKKRGKLLRLRPGGESGPGEES